MDNENEIAEAKVAESYNNGYEDGYAAGYQKGLEECKRIGRLDNEGMLYISEEEYNTMSKAMLIVMYLKDVQNMLGEFEV